MKKQLFFLFFLIGGGFTAFAQEYKAFKVDLSLGYAAPTGGGEGTKAGLTFTIEPHYRLFDELAVGLRFEGAALARVNNTGNDDSDAKVSVLSSYTATGDYYFGKSSFRPFAGAGLGFFKSASVTLNESTMQNGNTEIIPGSTQFGFFPRVGFETGHFRMSGEYNMIKDGGYLAAKIGFFFGGGKKSK
ncbi:outer membrane beta-barrel protein [Pedobacter sp.]|uniref:outer membrane beta-barrel protein n=1 Tax=Pedobacter sp. TaxID=1411316 RepID=UPI00396C4720